MIFLSKKRIGYFGAIFIAFLLVVAYGCRKHPLKQEETHETGTVADVDGNTYKTVKIGDQWWMAENLKVTKYQDSSLIRKIQTDTSLWNNDTIGAYCLYDDNHNASGFLYSGYAATNPKKIAPVGWHIPSDEEWKTLEKYLKMSQKEADDINFRGTHEGEKLRETGNERWSAYSDIWSTNESGFSAIPGGCRMFNGLWGDDPGLSKFGFWWSSTDHAGNNEAWFRHLDYKKPNVFRYYGPKSYGFSVRCVKD